MFASYRKRSSLEAIADLEAGFKATGVTPKEGIADTERHGTIDVPKNRDLGLVEGGGPSEELCDFMQGMQRDNTELRADCAGKNAARSKRLLEMSALWPEKVAQ